MAKETRNTRQKRIIEEKIREFKSFFTAEDLFEKVSKKDNKIGIATIYRFLSQFSKEDKIHLFNCKGKKIYSNNKNNHCHFVCNNCGGITHFSIEEINFVKDKIKDKKICHFQIDVYGICENCSRKEFKQEN